MDIAYFYLETPMIEFEYLRVSLSIFLMEIQQQYTLQNIAHNNHVIFCGLVYHHTHKAFFTLVINDFSIQYTNSADLQHLMTAVQKNYCHNLHIQHFVLRSHSKVGLQCKVR